MSQDSVERLFGADKSHQYWVGGQALQPSVQVMTRPAPRSPVPVQKSWIRQHPIISIALLGLGLTLLTFAFPANANGVVPPMGWITAGVGMTLLCLVPLGYLLWKMNRGINENMKVVQQGIPDPQTIRMQFIASMGREPTVQEVEAIHTMAKTRHNQALLNVGIGVGGAVLAAHTIRNGGKIL